MMRILVMPASIMVTIHRHLAVIYLKENSPIPQSWESCSLVLVQEVWVGYLGSCSEITSSGGFLASTLEARELPAFSLRDSSELWSIS